MRRGASGPTHSPRTPQPDSDGGLPPRSTRSRDCRRTCDRRGSPSTAVRSCARWTPMTRAAVVSSTAVRSAIARFLAAPASPLPFGVLRIGLGLVLLVQALSVVSYLADTYGTRGLVQSALVDRLVPPLTPRVGWFVALLGAIGIDEVVAIRLFFALHLGSVLAFTLGWRSRIAAVLTWATFVTLTTSGPLYTYGVDRFVRIALFY